MPIKIFAFQIINFDIHHNVLRPNIIINYFESCHNFLPCNITGEIRKQFMDERHNEIICNSSLFSLGTA